MPAPKLFQPLRLGRMQLEHRVVMAPMTRFRADDDHVQLPSSIEHYAQRAAVPGTLIIAEGAHPSLRHRARPHAPGIWSEAQIQRWKEITDAVHTKGCFMVMQLCAPGRPAVEGFNCVSSSAVPIDESSPVPREMTEQEIWECIDDFVSAAKNSIRAGFDGVELHGANGYLVDQFIQDTCNFREDKWGGSVENRSRFALELTSAVVKAIGSDRVGIRFSPWSTFQSMRMEDPAPQFSFLVKNLKEYDLAYLHIIESRVNNIDDVEKAEGIEFLLDIWNNQSPVLVAGGFTAEKAKAAVEEEYSKYDTAVVFGRYFLSTPDLVFRLRQGLGLNQYDRSTFFVPVQLEGYIDYPFSTQYVTSVGN